ncbi:MAG: glycosyl transferase [Patescibacteria group bacterium]|nr:MAG: glycosyl transferase [Patescibacteria group bacterium]
MRIGIDARLSGAQHAGIGRYTQNLLREALKQNKRDIFVCFFYNEEQATAVLGPYRNNKNLLVVYTPIRHYTLAEQIELPKQFAAENLDLLHVPHFNIPIFYKGKLIITIHDLLWHEYKGSSVTTLSPIKYVMKYLFYRLVTRIAVHKAEKILVPAETIKNTVIKFYPKTKLKIVVTKEGAEIADPKKITHQPKLKNTLLYVGSLYPHKNLNLILQSLGSLPKYRLLIAGARSVFQDRVKAYVKQKGVEEQVEFLGYVPDEKLAQLYQQVTALVQPSFSEGFGLTGIEAMSFGTSVLASDIPIFKEIYQNAAFYFSPHSSASFIQAVHALEQSSDKTNFEGKALVKNYSWEKMAAQTLEVYQDIVKKK